MKQKSVPLLKKIHSDFECDCGRLARGRRGEDVLVLMELKGKFVEVFGNE